MCQNSQWNLSKISKLVKTDLFTGLSILAVAYLYISHLKDDERPMVSTRNGKVKGVMSFSRDYQKYNAYLGIPYARAPKGDLRFEPPQPAEDWEGVRDAGYYRSQCISLELLFVGGVLFGSEDCLFLNVFAKPTVNGNPHPVMVFFHGGMYHFGSAEDHGEKYFLDQNVVFVTVTYRLGALGFLNSGDSIVSGNNGLKDQVMALRWIKDNIESFGGDPGKVTIFGESAGGHAVGLHILSPMSRGLFQKAIIQSGAPLSQWGTLKHDPGAQAKRFAKQFNCPTRSSQRMVDCLKALDAKTLVYGHMEAIDFFRTRPMVFTATIETVNDSRTAFITEDPEKLLERGDFPRVILIMGVNADEGLLQSSALSANATKMALMSQLELSLPLTLQYRKNDTITEKLTNFYFDKLYPNGTQEDFLHNLTNLFSDRHFYQPFYRTAKYYSKHAPLYLYYFNFSSFHSMEHFIADRETRYLHPMLSLFVNHSWRVFQEFILGIPIRGKGVCHGSELPLLFNHPWTPWFYSKLPERDVQMSKDLINLWVSFARSWETVTLGKQAWERVKPGEPFKYLEISRNPKMIDEPFSERVQFWEEIVDQMEEHEIT